MGGELSQFIDRIVAMAGTARCWPHGGSGSKPRSRAHRERHAFRGGDYRHAAEAGAPALRPDLGRLAHLAGVVARRAVEGPHVAAGRQLRVGGGLFADSLFAGLDANDLILQAADLGTPRRRRDAGIRGQRRAGAPLDPCAGALHAGSNRSVLSGLRRSCGSASHPQRRAEPIPSLWGHVAGGGGDEAAKPFINEKVAAFLKKSVP